MNSDSFDKIGLSANSKKIQKTPLRPKFQDYSSPESIDEGTKKYKVYTKVQKAAIVADLKKAYEADKAKKECSADELIEYLDSLDKAEYNMLIEEILRLHAPFSLRDKENQLTWQKLLKQWRRQLKSWIKNIDKPETRGSARVVAPEKTNEFKQRLIETLKNMSVRSFALLRQNAIAILEEMHHTQNLDQPFNKNTFSKHFWYDFKRLHPEIAELYERLPDSRCKPSGSSRKGKALDYSPEFEDLYQQFSSLSEENKSSSPCQTFESESALFEEEHFDWPDFSVIEQSLSKPFEETKEAAISYLPVPEFINFDENDDKDSNYDFYEQTKMIVESEDNQSQKDLFKLFYLNGI